MSRYAERGMEVLRAPEYIANVEAMTKENLISKADIAAELAFRDIHIRELERDRDSWRRLAERYEANCTGKHGSQMSCGNFAARSEIDAGAKQ